MKINKNISKIIISISSQLKLGEKLIKDFSRYNIENAILLTIKLNMQQLLYNRFTEYTKKFKLNQEIHKNKYKELIGEEDPTYQINSSSKIDNIDTNNTFDNFLMTTENNLKLVKRDNELDNLLSSVNDLAEIFKDMQNLVMEQGSILDRIDYNIDIAASNVSSGKKSIEKADKYHKKIVLGMLLLFLLLLSLLKDYY